MEIRKIENSFYQSNTYVLLADKCAWLVDIGDAKPVIDLLRLEGKELLGVFLTHTHFDHIYGLNEIAEAYPGMKVYTSYNGMQSLYSDKWNMSRYHHTPFVYAGENVEILKDKDEKKLYGNLCLRVYETPGHDWSSLCFLYDKYLFTGDSYLPQYNVVSNFPKSNKEEARQSLQLIKKLLEDEEIICCPGHGEMVIK